jgi:hypothetical protein
MHRERASWTAAKALAVAAQDFGKTEYAELQRLLGLSCEALEDFGGDPSHEDWVKFRPLRLSREEDWTDWLGHLIETSRSGFFGHALLGARGGRAADYAFPEVAREKTVVRLCEGGGERRADVVIDWKNGSASQIEVKVGDEEYEKTFETAALIRDSKKETVTWSEYILLRDSAVQDWNEVAERLAPKYPMIKVEPITWRQVAVALRRALGQCGETGEDLAWRVWAYSFCGAIEHRILGVPRSASGHGGSSCSWEGRHGKAIPVEVHFHPSNMTGFLSQVAILREAAQ